MKNVVFVIFISVLATIISCNSGNDKNEKISTEDSIENILLGTWKEEGRKMYLEIEKADELFTITNNAGTTYAYKLNGQILNSIDGTGPTYSLIGNKKLLKGAVKYSKIKDQKESTNNNENNSSSTADNSSELNSDDSEVSTTTTTSSSRESGTTDNPATASNISKTNKTKTTESGTTVSTTNTTRSTTTKSSTIVPKQLTIICNGITYLRQSPSPSGAVIRGLANGQECPIIKRGNLSKAYGKTDYWYQVKSEGDKGWVFGSLTNLSQNN